MIRAWWKLVAFLIAVAMLVTVPGCGSDSGPSNDRLPQIRQVAERVEAIRGLRFKKVPEVRRVSERQLEKELEKALPDPKELTPAERRQLRRAEQQGAASEELLRLTGIVEEDTSLEDLAAEADLELGGIYDPTRREIMLIDSPGDEDPKKTEAIVAHELVHALEDQHFGTFGRRIDPFSDQGAGLRSLLEGTATLVDIRYAIRHLGAKPPAERVLERRQAELGKSGIRGPLRAAIAFPYVSGARFAAELFRSGGGWGLLNRAQKRPPVSSEQILHPDKWRQRERPESVSLGASDLLGRPWRRLGSGAVGEFDTSLLLAVGDRRGAARAAAGWGGGRFEVWHREPGVANCPSPCRKDTIAVLGWRWDTPSDAGEFGRAARIYTEQGLNGRRTSVTTWELEDGVVTLGVSPRVTSLVFAPSADLGRRLAAHTLETQLRSE